MDANRRFLDKVYTLVRSDVAFQSCARVLNLATAPAPVDATARHKRAYELLLELERNCTQRANAHAAALDAFRMCPSGKTRSELRNAMYQWVAEDEVDHAFQRLVLSYSIDLYNAHKVTPLILKTKKQIKECKLIYEKEIAISN